VCLSIILFNKLPDKSDNNYFHICVSSLFDIFNTFLSFHIDFFSFAYYFDHKIALLVKKKKVVTRKQQETHGCYITMRCSQAAVNNTTLTLPDRLKERLKDLGFGSLLIMNIEGLEDRVLGAYLLSSVHDNPLLIEI
ncbi:hypothetical protein ACJX0J_007376, partial [Zea mays]